MCWSRVSPPKFNKFTPLKNAGTGRRSGFLLGAGNFSGTFAVKLRGGFMVKLYFGVNLLLSSVDPCVAIYLRVKIDGTAVKK